MMSLALVWGKIQALQPREVALPSFRGRKIGRPWVREIDIIQLWAGGGDGFNGLIGGVYVFWAGESG